MSTPTTDRRFVRANLVVAAGTGLSRLTGFGRVAGTRVRPRPDVAHRHLQPREHDAERRVRAAARRHPHDHPRAGLREPARSRRRGGDRRRRERRGGRAARTHRRRGARRAAHRRPVHAARAAPRIKAAVRSEATTLARFFLPQIVFYGITSLGIALLNSRRRFAAAAFAPVLNNVIVIARPHRAPPRRERRHQPRHRARQPLDHAACSGCRPPEASSP